MKKYYHIHVNYGSNDGYSAWIEVDYVDGINDSDIIKLATNQNEIDPDDADFVDEVNETTKDDFLKATL